MHERLYNSALIKRDKATKVSDKAKLVTTARTTRVMPSQSTIQVKLIASQKLSLAGMPVKNRRGLQRDKSSESTIEQDKQSSETRTPKPKLTKLKNNRARLEGKPDQNASTKARVKEALVPNAKIELQRVTVRPKSKEFNVAKTIQIG